MSRYTLQKIQYNAKINNIFDKTSSMLYNKEKGVGII